MSSIGYLIINLGTPDHPDIASVRRYLNEFLMDPYVVDLPWPMRRLLLSAIVLPFRPKKTARAYTSIWSAEGSPLLVHGRTLQARLAEKLNGPVALGMRYGNPGIHAALQELLAKKVDRIVAIPLYPQFADSTVTTCVQAVQRHLKDAVPCSFVTGLYRHQDYIGAQAASIKAHLPRRWDHLLLSFHGLPQRQLKKADPTGTHCLQHDNCCQMESVAHQTCYRHQVYETSRKLAAKAGLQNTQYSVSFQSRLGRGWLIPYTDEVLRHLPRQGVKHLAVACPGFVADNLETLEEIGIRGQQTFYDAGGESFHLLPCLNDDSDWVEALVNIVHQHDRTIQTEPAKSDTSL